MSTYFIFKKTEENQGHYGGNVNEKAPHSSLIPTRSRKIKHLRWAPLRNMCLAECLSLFLLTTAEPWANAGHLSEPQPLLWSPSGSHNTTQHLPHLPSHGGNWQWSFQIELMPLYISVHYKSEVPYFSVHYKCEVALAFSTHVITRDNHSTKLRSHNMIACCCNPGTFHQFTVSGVCCMWWVIAPMLKPANRNTNMNMATIIVPVYNKCHQSQVTFSDPNAFISLSWTSWHSALL